MRSSNPNKICQASHLYTPINAKIASSSMFIPYMAFASDSVTNRLYSSGNRQNVNYFFCVSRWMEVVVAEHFLAAWGDRDWKSAMAFSSELMAKIQITIKDRRIAIQMQIATDA
jgi:hypothetical protein